MRPSAGRMRQHHLERGAARHRVVGLRVAQHLALDLAVERLVRREPGALQEVVPIEVGVLRPERVGHDVEERARAARDEARSREHPARDADDARGRRREGGPSPRP